MYIMFALQIQILKHVKFLLKLQSTNTPAPSAWKNQIVTSMMKALDTILKRDAVFMAGMYFNFV